MARKNYSESEKLKKEKVWTIRRIIVIVLAAAAVIAALSVAWFVSNTRVQFTGMSVSADMKSVELRTYGGAGIHDDLLKKVTGADQDTEPKSFWYGLAEAVSDTVNKFFETSPEKYAINWLLSDQSNIGNYSTEQSDWEGYWKNPQNRRQDKAIEPGSSGKLQFFVVPKRAGDVSLTMQLSLIPYSYDSSTYKFTEANNIATEFITGHILFFLEENNTNSSETKASDTGTDGQTKLIWLKDGSFSITIKDAQKDSEYPYTLYWCWPQTFAELVLAKEDPILGEKDPILSQYTNGEEVRKMIVCGNNASSDGGSDQAVSAGANGTYSMVEMPSRYFYSNLTHSPLQAGQEEVQKISDIYNKKSNEMAEDAKNAFVDLSSYYNQADQYMGGQANCLRVKLEMQPTL